MTHEIKAQHITYTTYIRELCGIDCNVFDVVEQSFSLADPYFCDALCPHSRAGKCIHKNTHLYGCFESERWCGTYIYYCPVGLVFIANSIFSEEKHLDGGIITGPIVMTNSSDEGDASDELPSALLRAIPNMSTKKVRYLSEAINALCGYAGFCIENQVEATSQKEQHNTMYYISELYAESEVAYPIVYEKQLQNMVLSGDKEGSQELINQLLGHIYFCSNGSFETVKARIIELVVVLSRATIDAGADLYQIFWLNAKYLEEIEKLNDMEKINKLLSRIIHRFISCVFDFNNIKHVDVIYKAIEYIKEHSCEKISLEQVAEHVHLSKSYLSRIFKEEMNCNFTTYINKIRIEKSKSYLLNDNLSLTDIAMLTGFDDQSYFTKVFKRIIGVSPGKFRELRGNVKVKT